MDPLSRQRFLTGAATLAAGGMLSREARANGIPAEARLAPPGEPVPVKPAPGQLGTGMSGPAPSDPAERISEMQRPLTSVRFPRYDPDQDYSPPPELMGKQMGRVKTLSSPPLGHALDGDVKVFELIAQPVWHEFTDGDMSRLVLPEMQAHMNMPARMSRSDTFRRRVLAWGYNGVVPGPTIECTEGDRIRVVLKNELPEPTSIHWHGLECPVSQDGAAPETHAPVMPGETHEYEFTLYQSGMPGVN